MPRGIDHLVLAVHDLDAAGAFYEALGFRVGARNRHPWGTENRIVQFSGVFLELITVGEGATIAPHGPRHFSFGAFVRDFLAEGEGLAMLVLEFDGRVRRPGRVRCSRDRRFRSLLLRALGRASRWHVAPCRVFVGFRPQPIGAPRSGFFVCQQHEPENFWNAAIPDAPQWRDRHSRRDHGG